MSWIQVLLIAGLKPDWIDGMNKQPANQSRSIPAYRLIVWFVFISDWLLPCAKTSAINQEIKSNNNLAGMN